MYNTSVSARLRIPKFRGLWQYGDGMGTDMRSAVEGVNALTREGVLAPMAQCTPLAAVLPCPIETVACLHRRRCRPVEDGDVLVAAAGGRLYWMRPNDLHWQQVPQAPGFEQGYQSNVWSCVTYEIDPQDGSAPVDVLLLSNAVDGMICLRGDSMTAAPVPTPKKFGVIARHAERIWGGAITDDPDMLAYSAPYNPFNWQQNNEFPEDGAGDVLQPSWDGDSFTALTALGSQLVAFKRTRVWRVLGAHPGEYVFCEQYGGGTPCPATVSVDGSRIFMLGREGCLCYNGETVAPFDTRCACRVYERIHAEALAQACACMYRGRWYCALPLDHSPVNNAVLIYDPVEQTWLLREGVTVESFLATESALYFTDAATPGRLWQWREECARGDTAQPMRWLSPWYELDDKRKVKDRFALYLTVACDRPVTLFLTVETELGARQKAVTFRPGGRQRRILFGGRGHRVRFGLRSDGGAPWRIRGGVELGMEAEGDW